MTNYILFCGIPIIKKMIIFLYLKVFMNNVVNNYQTLTSRHIIGHNFKLLIIVKELSLIKSSNSRYTIIFFFF